MRAASLVPILTLGLALLAGPATAAVGPLEPLPPQKLPKAGCAMFVWARSEPAGPILMVVDGKARVRLGGRPGELKRVPGLSHGPQRFEGAGLTLLLDLDAGAARPMTGGAVAPDGLLTITDSKGGETVAPVAAVAGCRD
ncbi:hypothetical protein [Phenylobacterium sp.]|uniref:hypothetical protein n=1 Tax=Phenylobacterium sp. TaxID=1871053 RepID=UPI0039468EF9